MAGERGLRRCAVDAADGGSRVQERRLAADRRRRTLFSLMAGSFHRRRSGPRRVADAGLAATDWFAPQWLAAALLILLLCVGDALMTLLLVSHGAHEINPVMDHVLHGDGRGFATLKFALTAAGVVLLVLAARLKAFGRVPVSMLLYLVLAAYLVLMGYEYRLAQHLVPGL